MATSTSLAAVWASLGTVMRGVSHQLSGNSQQTKGSLSRHETTNSQSHVYKEYAKVLEAAHFRLEANGEATIVDLNVLIVPSLPLHHCHRQVVHNPTAQHAGA
jgi:FlaG/FlaF family flagellin (archaellin)